MRAFASNREERIGLLVALILHLSVVAAFVIQPIRQEVLEAPERMTVSLVSDVGLTATAPDPVEESRAALAPELADETQAAVAETQPQQSRESSQSADRSAITAPRRENQPSEPQQPRSEQIGENFLEGVGSTSATDDTRIPASEIGASARASLVQRISRQIKPHWNAPSGVDAELLVTELAFELNEDGTLKSRPRVLRQSGINASNRPQASLHAERAIRAVQLAAPFGLPDEYYNAWKSIRGARFDRNLSR
ncbi:MAG TPA: energy transducer TonB [Erythrobacter sp.]|nr:energy transducer TonB [Erythrobacter sp.]